jgi:hypothetical protein
VRTATDRHEELVQRLLRYYRPEVIQEAARRVEARRRRDAGQVAVTDRDVAALRFLGEQFGVRYDALRVLLARLSPGPSRKAGQEQPAAPALALSDRGTRAWVERMERDGYLTRRRLLGHTWVTPTVAGMALAGLTFERWKFGSRRDDDSDGWGLAHVHAVTMMRLHLQPDPRDGRWISERAIRRKWEGTGAAVRRADGALVLSDGRTAGIEVELHRKTRARYDDDVREVDPDFDEVWWFTPAGDVGWLSAVLEQLPQTLRPVHRVRALPAGVG